MQMLLPPGRKAWLLCDMQAATLVAQPSMPIGTAAALPSNPSRSVALGCLDAAPSQWARMMHCMTTHTPLQDENAEGIGYLVPVEVIEHFLTDYDRNGRYTGELAGCEPQAAHASCCR